MVKKPNQKVKRSGNVIAMNSKNEVIQVLVDGSS
jgi:hypothetical protein